MTVTGYGIYQVTSDSMEPILPVDSYLLVKKTTVEKLQLDDIILFETRKSIGNTLLTERVNVIHYFAGINESGTVQTYSEASTPNEYDEWGTQTTPYFVTSDDIKGELVTLVETRTLWMVGVAFVGVMLPAFWAFSPKSKGTDLF